MKWIILTRLPNSGSLLAYEFDDESQAKALFDSAVENSSVHIRMLRATVVAERVRIH